MAMPGSRQLRNDHGYALLYAGRYPEAVREFETYARLSPREANPYDSLGEAHLMMGVPERAIDHYARAMTVDPKFEGSHVGRAWGLAMLGRYGEAVDEDPSPTSMKMFIPSRTSMKAFLLSRVGRYREALQVLDAGHRQTEINQNLLDQGVLRLLSALIALERGQLAQARTELRTAEQRLAGLPEQRRRFYLVLLEFLAGMVDVKAGRLVESHHRASLIAERWWASSLEGDIALADGRLAEAAAAYSAGEPSVRMWTNMVQPLTAILANNSPSRDGAARVMMARADLAGAIQAYRRLLGPSSGQKFAAMLEPRHVLALARLLEQTGDGAAARHEYERFLDLWKNADAGLPETAEARRALLRLRS
jgi:tetratricopeptide (TPR) repeat protein